MLRTNKNMIWLLPFHLVSLVTVLKNVTDSAK